MPDWKMRLLTVAALASSSSLAGPIASPSPKPVESSSPTLTLTGMRGVITKPTSIHPDPTQIGPSVENLELGRLVWVFERIGSRARIAIDRWVDVAAVSTSPADLEAASILEQMEQAQGADVSAKTNLDANKKLLAGLCPTLHLKDFKSNLGAAIEVKRKTLEDIWEQENQDCVEGAPDWREKCPGSKPPAVTNP